MDSHSVAICLINVAVASVVVLFPRVSRTVEHCSHVDVHVSAVGFDLALDVVVGTPVEHCGLVDVSCHIDGCSV